MRRPVDCFTRNYSISKTNRNSHQEMASNRSPHKCIAKRWLKEDYSSEKYSSINLQTVIAWNGCIAKTCHFQAEIPSNMSMEKSCLNDQQILRNVSPKDSHKDTEKWSLWKVYRQALWSIPNDSKMKKWETVRCQQGFETILEISRETLFPAAVSLSFSFRTPSSSWAIIEWKSVQRRIMEKKKIKSVKIRMLIDAQKRPSYFLTSSCNSQNESQEIWKMIDEKMRE